MSHNPAQSDLIHGDDLEWDWLLLLDGARADVVGDELDGFLAYAEDEGHDLTTSFISADNGGIGFTKTWFEQMFPATYQLACFNPQPIHTFQAGEETYDERQHFALFPGMSEYDWDVDLGTAPPEAVVDVVKWYRENPVDDRLRALGYADEASVGSGLADRGLIRFLQPHPPLRQLVELTGGRANRIRKTADALRSGALTEDELADAYRDNLHWVLSDGVLPLLDVLEGTIVLTADHGECLGDCGQVFHSGLHDKHDHLRTVPWVVIESE